MARNVPRRYAMVDERLVPVVPENMMGELKQALGVLGAGSLMFSPTAVTAATPARIATQQVNPWAALAALSAGAPAATICGTAATTAQAGGGCVLPVMDAAPPPPPPVPAPVPIAAAGPGVGLNPLALGLLALVAGIGLYFAVHDSDKSNTPT